MTSVDFTAKGFQGGRGGEASSRPSFSSPPSSSCPSTGFALFSFFDWSPTPLCARQVTAEWMRGSVPAVPSLNPTPQLAPPCWAGPTASPGRNAAKDGAGGRVHEQKRPGTDRLGPAADQPGGGTRPAHRRTGRSARRAGWPGRPVRAAGGPMRHRRRAALLGLAGGGGGSHTTRAPARGASAKAAARSAGAGTRRAEPDEPRGFDPDDSDGPDDSWQPGPRRPPSGAARRPAAAVEMGDSWLPAKAALPCRALPDPPAATIGRPARSGRPQPLSMWGLS